MSEHDNKDALDALYQNRKRHYVSPKSIQQNMRAKLNANAKNTKPWWNIDLSSYFKISALAASVVLALLIVNTQFIDQQQTSEPILASAPLSYSSLELHVLDASTFAAKSARTAQAPVSSMIQAEADMQFDEAEELPSEMARVQAGESLPSQSATVANALQKQIKYQPANANSKKSERYLQIHHTRYAHVIQNQDGLSLVTCEQVLIKISAEVLVLLQSDTKQTLDITQGKLLTLSFDKNGHIIDIQNQQVKTQC